MGNQGRHQRLAMLALAPLTVSALLFACGGDDGGDTADDTKTLQERLFSGSEFDLAKQEQLVRECMTAQGFEYTPRDTRDGAATGISTFSADSGSEDFVREYGFAISTLFAREIDVSDQPVDPNMTYRDSLDDTQKEAYDRALYGQPSSNGPDGAGVAIGSFSVAGSADGEDTGGPMLSGLGGCMGEAFEEAGGGAQVQSFDMTLFDDLRDLEARIKADPKMVDAYKQWSACMAKSGYQYRDEDQLTKELREEFADITGLELGGDGGGFVISVTSVGGTGGNRDGGEDAFDPLANVDREKLSALQEKEKRMALASFECTQEHVAETEADVRERIEAEFLDSHPELQDRANP